MACVVEHHPLQEAWKFWSAPLAARAGLTLNRTSWYARSPHGSESAASYKAADSWWGRVGRRRYLPCHVRGVWHAVALGCGVAESRAHVPHALRWIGMAEFDVAPVFVPIIFGHRRGEFSRVQSTTAAYHRTTHAGDSADAAIWQRKRWGV